MNNMVTMFSYNIFRTVLIWYMINVVFTEWHQCQDRMYYVHDARYDFVTSISYCESKGASMALVGEDDIKDGAYFKACLSTFIPDGEHWIRYLSTKDIIIMYLGQVKNGTETQYTAINFYNSTNKMIIETVIPTSKLPPICDKPAVYNEGKWIHVKGNIEVYVVVNKTSHQMASKFCSKLNSTLATFPGSIKYFNVGNYLKLQGLFWIEEDSFPDSGDECASLDMSVSPSITRTKCGVHLESICCRPVKLNATELVKETKFVEMIKNMTVDEKQTSKSIRKYISADDKRRSAKVVGGLCGGIAVATVLVFMLSFDIHRLLVHVLRWLTK